MNSPLGGSARPSEALLQLAHEKGGFEAGSFGFLDATDDISVVDRSKS